MAYTSESRVTPNRSMFYRVEGLQNKTMNGQIAVGAFNQTVNRANFLANNFIPAGTVVALADSGHTYAGMWIPALLAPTGPTVNVGEEDGSQTILWDPVYLTRDDAGTIEQASAVGTFLIPGSESFVLRSKIPNIQVGDSLSVGNVFRTISATELSGLDGPIDVEQFGISGIAGL